MKVAIMQPYFLPYAPYFQLISSVDVFVVYDNIKYTKKGWINRNRFLRNGEAAYFTLPLRSGSDSLCVFERDLAENFSREKLLSQFHGAYLKAPFFSSAYELLEEIIYFDSDNLFEFIKNSLVSVCKHLEIDTKIVNSSSLSVDPHLKAQSKVIAYCQMFGADQYVNAIGGLDLYCADEFSSFEVDLKFIKSHIFEYKQFANDFVPYLSIVDALMFNSKETVMNYISNNYELV